MIGEFLLAVLPHLTASLLVWTAVGTFGGAVLALLLWWAGSRAGAWRLETPHAAWIRPVSALLLVGAFATLGGMGGGCEGTWRGAREAVASGPFRENYLEPASEAGAWGLMWLDLRARNVLEDKPAELTPEQRDHLAGFVRGERELHPGEFLARLRRLEARVLRRILPAAVAAIREKYSFPEGEFVDSLLESAVEGAIRKALREDLGRGLAGEGADVRTFLETLDEAAASTGDPDRLSATELSLHLVDRLFVPVLVGPTRTLMRTQSILCAAGMAGALGVALAAFALLRRVISASAASRARA